MAEWEVTDHMFISRTTFHIRIYTLAHPRYLCVCVCACVCVCVCVCERERDIVCEGR